MKLLGIDVGRNGAWCFGTETGLLKYKKNNSLVEYKQEIQELIEKYSPDAIVVGKPTMRFNTLRVHWILISIVHLCAEIAQIEAHEVLDKSIKKIVTGNGKSDKDEVLKWATPFIGEVTHDEADAYMFTVGYPLSVK